MRTDLPIADVKALLLARCETLVRELCPDGARAGLYWMARNPARDDRRAGSFWVIVKGGSAGVWRDEATGDHGDVLKLIAYVHGSSLGEAIRWAKGWLGLAAMEPGALEKARTAAVERDRQRDRAERLAAEDKARKAFGWWLHAERRIAGTPVEAYLAARGIELSKLARAPGAIRYLPRAEHRASGTSWPAMIAAMTNEHGSVVAVHRTFLERDGSGKAPVTPQKMIWPSFRGCSIRLSRGVNDCSVEEASRQGLAETLILCEGIEDGLSLALAMPEARVWAAATLGNLGEIVLPVCAQEVIVAADNDWGKPQAERMLSRGIEALARQGRPVRVARSTVGKDFNDALRGAA